MSLTIFLQIASSIAVVIALFLTFWQIREMSRQTREVGNQAKVGQLELQRIVYQELISYETEFNTEYLKDEPELLTWFLESRGIPVDGPMDGKRKLYLFTRLGIHESNFLAHSVHLLDDDLWSGWENVLNTDAATREFRVIWPHIRRFYVSPFAAHVDRLLDAITTAGASRPGSPRPIET